MDLSNEPTPIGCFKDGPKRDMTNKIGYDISPEECI